MDGIGAQGIEQVDGRYLLANDMLEYLSENADLLLEEHMGSLRISIYNKMMKWQTSENPLENTLFIDFYDLFSKIKF